MPYSVDIDKWSRMTIFEQMGNIYSEVGRSFNAVQRGDKTGRDMAVERAIDLFGSTVAILVERKSPKVKEVLRAKEEYLKEIFGETTPDSRQSLDKYFMQFAIAARLNK